MADFWEIDLHRKLSVPGEKVARAGVSTKLKNGRLGPFTKSLGQPSVEK
jgi:hypothetical protein